tara:strand:- start:114 stop:281 length:168 start_codon:yes stop_codon:yes gene_type:complete
MNTELKEERSRLFVNKFEAVGRLKVTKGAYDEALEDFAAADMALKEFERKHGGGE